jgi:hypothetical protein
VMMCEPKLRYFAQVRPLVTNLNNTSNMANFYSSHHCDNEYVQSVQSQRHYDDVNANMYASEITSPSTKLKNKCVRTKSSRLKKSKVLNFSEVECDFPSMQTMDRRVSSSSDQIDTLRKQKMRTKPLRTHSSSRLSFERKFCVDDDNEDVEFITSKIHRQCDLFSSSFHRSIPRSGGDVTKTPFALFLEDDGPYSRKLFGPLTHRESYKERQGQDRGRRQERIVYRRETGQEDHTKVGFNKQEQLGTFPQ